MPLYGVPKPIESLPSAKEQALHDQAINLMGIQPKYWNADGTWHIPTRWEQSVTAVYPNQAGGLSSILAPFVGATVFRRPRYANEVIYGYEFSLGIAPMAHHEIGASIMDLRKADVQRVASFISKRAVDRGYNDRSIEYDTSPEDGWQLQHELIGSAWTSQTRPRRLEVMTRIVETLELVKTTEEAFPPTDNDLESAGFLRDARLLPTVQYGGFFAPTVAGAL